jgi:GT2 family glycosyltransferase
VNVLQNKFPDIHMLVNTHNAGYASGNNLGIKWAIENNADYVLILNNDVIIDKYLITELLACIQKDHCRGVVSGKIYYKNNPKRIYAGAGRIIRWRCTGVNRGTVLGRLFQKNKECSVNYICGALFLTRSNVFEVLGLLDEKYFMYFEDLEFSRRVSSRYSMVYTPAAVAYHKSGGGTRWTNYPEVYLYYQTRNRFWVFEREPFCYRAYVMVFTIFVTIAKTIVILFSIFKNKSQTWNRLMALWKGLKDGIMYYIS